MGVFVGKWISFISLLIEAAQKFFHKADFFLYNIAIGGDAIQAV